jgi:hypothetical protein
MNVLTAEVTFFEDMNNENRGEGGSDLSLL